MKISTTTGVLLTNSESERLRDIPEIMKLLKEVGFEALDMSFCMHDRPNYILAGDDWERRIHEIGETAAELGLELYQSHVPFVSGAAMAHNQKFRDPDYRSYFDECLRRACIANGILGVKWAVGHPLTFPELNYERKASLDANRAYYDSFVELCIKNGTGFAFENALPNLARKHSVRYCQHYDELIELVDSYADPMVGICWDTGHANQMELDQGRAIRMIGDLLKVLHINDNHYGTRDEHLLPFMGKVNWNAVIDALVEIEYQGTLNYETVVMTRQAYGEIQMELVRAICNNGVLLRQMYEKARQAMGTKL